MPGDFRLGSWMVRHGLNTIECDGKRLRLEPKAIEVLVCLADNAGETVPKERLIRAVWETPLSPTTCSPRCISELSKGLEDDPKQTRVIQTIPKRGYRLLLGVERQRDRSEGPSSEGSKTHRYRTVVAAAAGIEPQRHENLLPGSTSGFRARRWVTAAALLLAILIGGLALIPACVRNRLPGRQSVPVIEAIAVLPLENLSGDPEQAYLADGMTEALINDLARTGAAQ